MNHKSFAFYFITLMMVLPYFVFTPPASAAEDTREQLYKEYNATATKSGISVNIGSSGKVIEKWEVTHNGTNLGKIGSLNGDTLSLSILNGSQKTVYGKRQIDPSHILWLDSAGTTWRTSSNAAGTHYFTGSCVIGGVSTCPGRLPNSIHSDLQQDGMAVTTTRTVSPADRFYFDESDVGDTNANQIPSSKVSPSSIKVNIGSSILLTRNISILNAGSGDYGYGMIRTGKLLVELGGPPGSGNNALGTDYQAVEPGLGVTLSGHAEGREYYMKVNTGWEGLTYEYSGKVKVWYKQVGPDPQVTVSCSSPATANFFGGDVSLQVSVTAKIWNVAASSVSNWQLSAESQNATVPGAVAELTKTFTVVIPADGIREGSNSRTISTKGIVKLTNNATYTGNCNTTTVVYFNPNPNKPPKAVIFAPEEVRIGDDVIVSGYSSYDLDGTITGYYWGTPGATGTIPDGVGGGMLMYNSTGQKRISLAVVDNEGAGDSTEKIINVLPPVVYAQIGVGGTKKVNRKVTLTNTSSTPSRYPLTSTQWSIEGVSGAPNAAIRYTGTLTDNVIDSLFKSVGLFKVTLTVSNSAGYSDTISTILDIKPDLTPIAQFSVPSWIYRSSADSGNAKLDIIDLSQSPDGDLIASKVLRVIYNKNNNYTENSIVVDTDNPIPGLTAKTIYANFVDDSYLDIDLNAMVVNQTYSYTLNGVPITALKKADGTIQLRSTNVGRYLIELRLSESFGQETIPQFVTSSDYLSSDTSSKPKLEKIVTIGNLAPTVDFKNHNDR